MYIMFDVTEYAIFTIIKPKAYKDLYVGVSGDAHRGLSSTDKKYYKGQISFKKTSWYINNKNSTKWMSVK